MRREEREEQVAEEECVCRYVSAGEGNKNSEV